MINNIIFGGSGFIGKHLIKKLGPNYLNLDIVRTEKNHQHCDVKYPIDIKSEKQIEIIYNLAAIHTMPGHEYHEYFETNIEGAENICNFARQNNINIILFTSSIAPYGTWEEEKFENSLPLPTSAYGISKLVAEEIHKRWQAENPNERKLIILRPGVVFGQNEGGNFTRLYKAMKSGTFFYPGRRDTKKAAVYVKDLVRIMVEMVDKEPPGFYLFNMAYFPIHSIEEICRSMAKVTTVREPLFTIYPGLLKAFASIINIFGKLIGSVITEN